MSIVAKRSPVSDTTELLLYNRKINMSFEEEIKNKIQRSVWKFRRVVKKFEVVIEKNKLRRRRRVVEKCQSQSKKFDAIDVRL